MAEVEVEKKGNNTFKYIFLFILFLIIGGVAGYFGTKYYMDHKKSNDKDRPVYVEGPEDISEMDEYKELIQKLHSFVDGNPLFYSTKGYKVEGMANNERLSYIYDYLVKNSMVTDDSLVASYGANNCLGQIGLDNPNNSVYSNNNTCSVKRVSRDKFNEINKTLFNDELVDSSVSFTNSDNKLCIVDENDYLCGYSLEGERIDGKLVAHFDVVKATKDEGEVVIYDKGYLKDERSNLNNAEVGYANFYLHSADSTDYYHELKNADNFTFKHTFITTDRVNYYYVSSELVKE